MDIAERLHQAGHKFTKPRHVVAQVLEETPQHLSAHEIWDRVQSIDDSIGRMSVYRTLDLFTRIGYIRPAPQNAADSRSGLVYVVLHNGHHHHIICQNCGGVIEFKDCGLDQLIARLEQEYGCQIEGHLLEFYGLCKNCRV